MLAQLTLLSGPPQGLGSSSALPFHFRGEVALKGRLTFHQRKRDFSGLLTAWPVLGLNKDKHPILPSGWDQMGTWDTALPGG